MYTIISAKRLSNGAGGSAIYTKGGTIRKDCTVTKLDKTPEQMKQYLDRVNYRATGTPYVFTHIVGEDLFGCKSIITQDYNGIMCSPLKLAELLGVK